jgi:DNA-binding NtrC family response regulator
MFIVQFILASLPLRAHIASEHERRSEPPMCDSRHPGPLLIVDDRKEILVPLQRLLSLHFEQVFTASTPVEAEAVLLHHRPRLLLCDNWLGDEYPPGTALIPDWRQRYPSLERVALMSGTPATALEPVSSADVVFEKPVDIDQLIDFFAGTSVESAI